MSARLRRSSRALVRAPTREVISMRELRTAPRRRGRKTPQDTYDPPLTDREWWRVTIKETPIPGTYEIKDFLQEKELKQIKETYNFKNEGRTKPFGYTCNGETLMPGAYSHKDFIEASENPTPYTYTFKNSGRKRTLPGIKDKHINVEPCRYELLRKPVGKKPIWHGSFKSQSSRFPTKYFDPKDGPGPGNYDPVHYQESEKIVTSSFRSRVPRFKPAQTKVPGPGAYAATFQTPQARTLAKMGRMHGLFFRNSFDV